MENTDKITRTWYSETYINKVIVPNLSSWQSRYDTKEELLLKNGRIVKRSMTFADMFPTYTDEDTQHRVTPAEQYRPDVIADNMYGDGRLAWVILSANNITDIFDLTTDMIIRIPSLGSLYRQGGVLNR